MRTKGSSLAAVPAAISTQFTLVVLVVAFVFAFVSVPIASAQTCAPAWNAATAYATAGTQVSRTCGSAQNYESMFWTQNQDPCTNSGPSGSGQPWRPLGACGGGATPTATSTTARATATSTTGATATATATSTPTATTGGSATATATSPTPTPTPPTPPPTATATTARATATATSGGGGGTHIRGLYWADWDMYQRNWQPKNVVTSGQMGTLEAGADNSFINFAFGKADNATCSIGDVSDYDKYYDANGSCDGLTDSWDAGALRGPFNQFKKCKGGVKIIYSFGGWTWSGGFAQAAGSATAFANSCYNFVNGIGTPVNWGGTFDGIDIDWEYPNSCGLTCDSSGFSSYKTLMSALHSRFKQAGSTSPLVTSAITADGTSGGKIDAADYGGAAAYVDWYNLMTYDYFGAWAVSGPTAPHSPLHSYPGIPTAGFYSDAAVQKLKSKGVPGSKMLLGVGAYGRGWAGVTQAAPGGSATGPVAVGSGATYEAGIEDYYILATRYTSVNISGAGTSYGFGGGQWWGYDSPSDITNKMNYVTSQGLGGAFMWESSGDRSNALLSKLK